MVSTSLSTSSTEGPAGAGGHEQGPLLEVGRITRPHGLRGDVVVELWTNRRERVQPGARLRGPPGELEVEHATRLASAGGRERWLVQFSGVSDRAGAEALRDVVLSAAPIDDGGALWIHDLIGSEVVDSAGTRIGTVTAVEANPASDLLVLDGGQLIPLRFITERGSGRLKAELPSGLLEL
jgi:16S rRNA processing protein RimM